MAIETPPSPIPQPHIDLQKGWPTPRLLPSQALLTAADATLSDTPRAIEAMLYGPEMGDPSLRHCVANWLSRLYRLRSPPACSHQEQELTPISSTRICITNGASGNLAAITAAFTDPVYTRRIWMVEPTYFLACTIFEDGGFQNRLVGVPEEADGLDVEYLRAQIEAVDRESSTLAHLTPRSTHVEHAFKRQPQYSKLYRHVIYLVPTFSNPSAKTYTLARREALVKLARDVDALIVTDDCYDFLSWTVNGKTVADSSHPSPAPPPPPRLVDIDASLPGGDPQWGNAVSNGSFSKVIGPGLRCGWAEATPAFIERLNLIGPTRSGGAPSQFSSTLVEHVLRTGTLESHLHQILIPTYQSRSAALRLAIEENLGPLGVQIDMGRPYILPSDEGEEEIIGGFFLYIMFPEGVMADEVATIALRDYNLRFLPAGAMAVRGSKLSGNESLLRRGARLCWAWEEEERLVTGVERMAQVLKEGFLL